MRGLVIKDILNLKQQAKIYAGILVLFFVVGLINSDNMYFASIMPLFMILVPMTTMGYDEKSGWDSYAMTMPLRRKDIVYSKYVISALVFVAVIVFSLIGSVIITGDVKESLILVLLVAPMGLIINDVFLPLIFRFGIEKSRAVFLGLFVAVMCFSVIIKKLNITFSGDVLASASPVVMIVLLWAAAVAATLISMKISAGMYRRKDF